MRHLNNHASVQYLGVRNDLVHSIHWTARDIGSAKVLYPFFGSSRPQRLVENPLDPDESDIAAQIAQVEDDIADIDAEIIELGRIPPADWTRDNTRELSRLEKARNISQSQLNMWRSRLDKEGQRQKRRHRRDIQSLKMIASLEAYHETRPIDQGDIDWSKSGSNIKVIYEMRNFRRGSFRLSSW